MKYRVVSPLVGTPGEIYNPTVIVNFHALVLGGFIVPDEPTPADEKPAKTKSKKTDQE